jgi:hypothetical protein
MNQENKDKKIKINKNNYIYFALYAVIIIVIVIAGIFYIKNKQAENLNENNNNESFESEIGDNNNEDNSAIENNNSITIENINSGDLLTSPVLIKGKAKTIDNKVFVELRNNNHEALVKEWTAVRTDNNEEMGDYGVNLDFYFRNTSEGYVAVYESEENKSGLVEIPVNFKTID